MRIPAIPLEKLTQYLRLLPYSHVTKSEAEYLVYAYLTPVWARGFAQELHWTVIPVIFPQSGTPLSMQDYDTEAMQWKSPQVLTEYVD